ncbi:unnamed protein product [Owenia fusiformis]|nr:unnamed protein product [Owenia fusiformis]
MFTYSGWEFLFMLLEEVRDPNKNVPRAVHTSFISVIALYILTNIAYFSVMTPEEVLNSNAVAVTFAERTIGPAAVIIPIFVACSCAGALNGAMLGGSRVTFAAGREGHLPEFLSMISVKYFTPWPALMIGSIIGFIYICEDGIISLIEYMSFVALIEFLIVKLSLLYLRWKKPNDERPVKVNIVLAMCTILSDVAMTFLALYKQPTKNGIAILLVLSGVPVYLIGVRWKSKPKPFLEFMRKLTHTLQKTLMVVPPASIAKPDGDTHKDV